MGMRRAGQGCRRVSTWHRDQYLLLYVRRNRRNTREPYKVTSSRLLMFMFPTKLLETDSMRVTICSSCPLVEPVLTALHCVAQLVFSREHQNWHLYHQCPVLFTQRVWTPVPNAVCLYMVHLFSW